MDAFNKRLEKKTSVGFLCAKPEALWDEQILVRRSHKASVMQHKMQKKSLVHIQFNATK